jgi:hypothetical protein
MRHGATYDRVKRPLDIIHRRNGMFVEAITSETVPVSKHFYAKLSALKWKDK